MFLRVLEIISVIAALWFVITQILFPAIRGTKVFPIFRREAKLVEELVGVNQKIREKKLEDTIKETKKNLDPENKEELKKPEEPENKKEPKKPEEKKEGI